MVIRDHHGRVQVTREGRLHGVMDALSAEAMSCHEGLSWLKTNGFQRVSMMSDGILLVEVMNKNVKYKSPVGLIMKDCVSLLKEILECNLCFVRRSVNKAAHCLASAASSRCDPGDYAINPSIVFSYAIALDLIE